MQLITSARTPAANLSARTPALADRLEAWGATFLFGMFKFLPLDCASALGGALARRIGPFLGASKQARRNISRAFPGLSETQIAGVVGSMWDNLGRLAAEGRRAVPAYRLSAIGVTAKRRAARRRGNGDGRGQCDLG